MSAMNCRSCSRTTLQLFIRSLVDLEPTQVVPAAILPSYQISRFSSAARRPQAQGAAVTTPALNRRTRNAIGTGKDNQSAVSNRVATFAPKEKERWQIEKAAIKEKLRGEAWNPRKKLSPDTMEGMRHLHQTQPEKFTTERLAQQFKISPDAVRRILKSKWRPSDEEQEDRSKRWDKRGERIWNNLVELGVKPPKKWREMGVGRAQPGQKPLWKSRSRNRVPIHDSAPSENAFEESLIPIVDGKTGTRKPERGLGISLSDRML